MSITCIEDTRTISLALTHHNRYAMLVESFRQVYSDPRISEIVISDDFSTDGSFEKISRHAEILSKLRVSRNDENLDCYFNKQKAVERCAGNWVILFDSDNIMTPAYLDALYAIPQWDDQTAYLPEWAMPHFDYRAFSGKVFDRRNTRHHLTSKIFVTALNTANYFFNRKMWLDCWDGNVNPHTSDSIYQNYNWMAKDGKLMIVPGLRYEHRIHPGSHYKKNWRKTGTFAKHVEHKLRRLR